MRLGSVPGSDSTNDDAPPPRRLLSSLKATPHLQRWPGVMTQVLRPEQVFVLKFGASVALIVLVAAILLWRNVIAESPPVNSALAQIPPFSHKHHISDVGLDCRFCHASVET